MSSEDPHPPADPLQALEAAVAMLRGDAKPREEVPTLVIRGPRNGGDDGRPPAVPVERMRATSLLTVPHFVVVDGAGTVTMASSALGGWLVQPGAPIVGRPLDELVSPLGVREEGALFAELLRSVGEAGVVRVAVRGRGPETRPMLALIQRLGSIIKLESFSVSFELPRDDEVQVEGDWELPTLRCFAEIGTAVVEERSFEGFLRRTARVLRSESGVAGLRVRAAHPDGSELGIEGLPRTAIVIDVPDPLPSTANVTQFATSASHEPKLCVVETVGSVPSEGARVMLDRATQQLSLAIAKRWAEERLLHLARHFTSLDATSRDIAGAALDPAVMAGIVAKRLGHARGTVCSVELWDELTDERIVSVAGSDPAIAEEIRVYLESERTIESRERALVRSMKGVSGDSEPPHAQQTDLDRRVGRMRAVGIEVRSMISAPVRAYREDLGVIAVYHHPPARPSIADEQVFLRALADRLGLAVANARLFRDNAEHLERLEERVTLRTAELARALADLRHTQTELVRAEKLSSLGVLVAGIAHELNTPIGNAIMVSSTLEAKIREFKATIAAGPLRKADFEAFVQATDEAAELMLRCLGSARDQIVTFKQVAADQGSEQRRRFELGATVRDVVEMMQRAVRRDGHAIELHASEGIWMDSFPGASGRVVANLVQNANLHAFEGREGGGTIRVSVGWSEPSLAFVEVEDDGVGIPDETLPRIFDPFFTTKLGRGGSGLGLHIVFNLVSNVLGGRMKVRTEVGRGTTFRVELPATAPTRPTSPGGSHE